MAVLVTGGAGYIGSIVTEELFKDGYEVIVLDNLQKGHPEAVAPGILFVQADLTNYQALEAVFSRYKIDTVMHMAAETEVETSMVDPRKHYRDNVAAGLTLLEAMLSHDVKRIIFSSSAAIYGEPQSAIIEETHSQIPINAYGETKLIFERTLGWYQRAYGLQYICLRYFNAAGASQLHGEDHRPETHLIPKVMKAILSGDNTVNVFGADYATSDGSCIRDYVHVIDIARAHILAMMRLKDLSGKAFNLGSGEGYSVLEVTKAIERVCGQPLNIKICPRRYGDPARLVASSKRARELLEWKPQYSNLEEIAASAWNWLRKHPQGYPEPAESHLN